MRRVYLLSGAPQLGKFPVVPIIRTQTGSLAEIFLRRQ
jgi:hypothetical protein